MSSSLAAEQRLCSRGYHRTYSIPPFLCPQALIRHSKDIRAKEVFWRDRVANLKLELEEAKERKKVGIAEREQIRKGLCTLYKIASERG